MLFLETVVRKARSRFLAYIYTESLIFDLAGQPELRNTVIIAGDGSYHLPFTMAKKRQEKGDKGMGKREG